MTQSRALKFWRLKKGLFGGCFREKRLYWCCEFYHWFLSNILFKKGVWTKNRFIFHMKQFGLCVSFFIILRFFNCTWTKFIAIIVNVCVFLCKIFAWRFWLFEWLNALDFLRFVWSKILSQSQFQAAELNWRQFNTKSQMKSAKCAETGVIFYFKS